MISAIVALTLVVSVSAFYSGRYGLFERLGGPAEPAPE
jgi:hypothetical protein